MKKIIALALALVMLLAAVGCSKQNDTPDGMKLASSDVVDYRLYVPETWIVDADTGMTGAHVSASDASSVSVMVWNLEDVSATPAEWWENYRADFGLVFEGFEVTAEEETLLDGVVAQKYEYVASLGENSYRFTQIVCLRRSMAYLFTYTSADALYDKNLEAAMSVADNFRFN